MNATAATETVPTTWIDERDVPFFRVTASLFDPEFVLGATVLLASYDSDAIIAAARRTLAKVC
jgi:hypothetical protein